MLTHELERTVLNARLTSGGLEKKAALTLLSFLQCAEKSISACHPASSIVDTTGVPASTPHGK